MFIIKQFYLSNQHEILSFVFATGIVFMEPNIENFDTEYLVCVNFGNP